jgi:hypothetical protein
LQTGYCEGIYIENIVSVGLDWFFTQTNETSWLGYVPNKEMMLGLFISHGEINNGLGIINGNNITLAFVRGLDLTRDFGPQSTQTYFNLTNCSAFNVTNCHFVGGNGSADTAFSFVSTYNSSDNIIGACHFENMTTIINLENSNATVGLETYALQLSNIPLSTAFVDNSSPSVGNRISFKSPAVQGLPAGTGCTKDHIFSASDGSPIFAITNLPGASNFIRNQPSLAGNPPTLIFDGADAVVNGALQTKGGNFYINASGGSSQSGNLISLLNLSGATNWVQIQNATQGGLCIVNTNSGGLEISPHGALWLSPSSGLFAGGLPTARPTIGSGQIWNNNGVLSIA